MFERTLAAVVVIACLFGLVRLMIGAPRRQRLDAALRRTGQRLRGAAGAPGRARTARRHAAEAAAMADEVIHRAQVKAKREGNVYTPEAFRKPPRDKMH